MRKLSLAIFILLSIFSVQGQTLTDSLLKVAEKADNKDKAKVYNQIAQSYLPGKPDKCLDYAQKAMDIAHQQRNNTELAFSYKNMGAAYFNLSRSADALKWYAKANEIFSKTNPKQYAAVYINIGLVYRESNQFKEALNAFNTAKSISQSASDGSGVATACHMMGSLSFRQGNYDQALKYYTEALEQRKDLKNKADIAASYSSLALVYQKTRQYDKAIENCEEALEIRNKLNNPSLTANVLNQMGNIYWDQKNWEKAFEFYFKSIKLRYQSGDQTEIANSYQNIGNLFKDLGNNEKAREYYLQALATYSETNDLLKMALTLTSLGNIEKTSGNFADALNYYQKALEIRLKTDDPKEIASSYNSLGNIFIEIGQTDKAIENFLKALEIRRKINDITGQLITLNDLGNIYEKLKKTDKSQTSYLAAYQLAVASNNLFYQALCGRKLAEIKINTNQLAEAEKMLVQSEALSIKLKNAELIKNVHYAWYLLFQQKKIYQTALEHFVKYSNLNDSILSAQNSQRMRSIQQNLELEKNAVDLRKAESEVQNLLQEKEIQSAKLERQKFLMIILIIILVLFIAIGLAIYNRYQIKKKMNVQLKEQNEQIEKANEQLKQKETELTALNATKDKFFTVVAHDLRNPLASLLNFSYLIVEKSDTLDTEQLKHFNQMVHESASNLNNLLENLLNWARSNTNKMRFYPLPQKLKPVVNSILLLNKITAENKKIKLVNTITDDIEVYADQQMLTSVIRNLVSNALKFTPEGGTITISAKDGFRDVEISVADTGKGISPEHLANLFRMDSHHSTPGTDNEVGTGLGLILVKEFVEKNQGKITAKSTVNEGSTFTFTLPTGKD
jgi:signal transduction histidine kinase/uncharacterized protein HemY